MGGALASLFALVLRLKRPHSSHQVRPPICTLWIVLMCDVIGAMLCCDALFVQCVCHHFLSRYAAGLQPMIHGP